MKMRYNVIDFVSKRDEKICEDEYDFEEWEGLAISRYIEQQGVDFYKLAEKNHLEGIVAKQKEFQLLQSRHSKVPDPWFRKN